MGMRKQITLALPAAVFEQANSIADATQQPLDKVLQDALEQIFSPFPLHEKHTKMAQEVEAYKLLHPKLVEKYLGKFVAIYGGKVTDYDEDVVALTKRVTELFPNEVVLIRRVEPTTERILNMRSPRFLSR